MILNDLSPDKINHFNSLSPEISYLINNLANDFNKIGGKMYFTGGYVRDCLLDRNNNDIDIEIHNIKKDEVIKILQKYGEVLEYGKSFGIFSIKGYEIDFSLPRRERKIGNKHTDFDIEIDENLSIKESQARRDFTINSIYKDAASGELIDCFNGQTDLNLKILKHTSDRFSEDPLRVLRAGRFLSKLTDFKIDDSTLELCKNIDISKLSKERIKTELDKALLSPKPSRFFLFLKETNHLHEFFPQLENLIGIKQKPNYHLEDCFNHTLLVLDECAKVRHKAEEPLYFMYAALCHDLGKFKAFNPNDFSFLRHEEYGVSLSEEMLRNFTNEIDLIDYVKNITSQHMSIHSIYKNKSHDKKIIELLDNSISPNDLCLFSVCDASGKCLIKQPIISNLSIFKDEKSYNIDDILLFNKQILDIYKKWKLEPKISGQDLINLGYNPGKDFSKMLARAKKLSYGNDKITALKQLRNEFPLKK